MEYLVQDHNCVSTSSSLVYHLQRKIELKYGMGGVPFYEEQLGSKLKAKCGEILDLLSRFLSKLSINRLLDLRNFHA